MQNRAKILHNMAFLLREDPRRRFVYGYTIEDVTMRLWFASRSDVIVSKPFDFMKVAQISYIRLDFLVTDHELSI